MIKKQPLQKTALNKKPRSLQKSATAKRTSRKGQGNPMTTPTGQRAKHPCCPRCGSRTVHLQQLQQELLATLCLHCLICGHHAFLGKPVVRLIRRPEIPTQPVTLKSA